MYGHLNRKRDYRLSSCRYDDMDYSSAVAQVQKEKEPVRKLWKRDEVLAACKQLGLM